jgi:sugar lactone lactonase YvrE
VNGMELSPDGDYLLLCETGRATIHKYYLKGM